MRGARSVPGLINRIADLEQQDLRSQIAAASRPQVAPALTHIREPLAIARRMLHTLHVRPGSADCRMRTS